MRRRLLLVAVVFLVVAGAAIAAWYESEIGEARAAAEQGAKIAQTAAGPIEYADQGSGPALLSIHGAAGGFDLGLSNATAFAGDGFRVIAPSRFGYLATPVPADASVEAQAEAHAALLDSLGVGKAVVLGVSAGARSAAALAIRHPERVSALILVSPATYAPTNRVGVAKGGVNQVALWFLTHGADFAWWATEKLAPSALIRFAGVPPEIALKAPEAERRRAMTLLQSIEPLSRRFAGIVIDADLAPESPNFETIKVPTLIISARDDPFNTLPSAQYAANAIPGASLIVHEEGGHLLIGHGADVREAVARFLKSAGVEP